MIDMHVLYNSLCPSACRIFGIKTLSLINKKYVIKFLNIFLKELNLLQQLDCCTKLIEKQICLQKVRILEKHYNMYIEYITEGYILQN